MVLSLVLGACGAKVVPPVAAGPSVSAAPLSSSRHVYVIVFENKDYASALQPRSAPYLASLATRYALATNYHGVDHPSQPNYLALFSGSTQGVTDDRVHDINAPNIADQIETAGLTWRLYAENVPSGCFTGSSASGGADGSGIYARKHNPAISFTGISGASKRCANITDFSHFDPAAANYSFIAPNLCHDMHDCSVTSGDQWLRSFLPRILDSDAFKSDGVLFITFDEEHGKGDANRVATVIISPLVTPGSRSNARYDHYSLLRTVQQLLGLPCLALSCAARDMSDLFARPTS